MDCRIRAKSGESGMLSEIESISLMMSMKKIRLIPYKTYKKKERKGDGVIQMIKS
jgi:hypothetical protein